MKNHASCTAKLAALVAITAFSGAALAQESNSLTTNASLKPGQQLRSANKAYRAQMQTDGNFVVYGEGNKVMWASGSNNSGGANGSLAMQGDGNLCVNSPTRNAAWCSYSHGNVGEYFTMLRDNGDLEIYRGTLRDTNNASLVWTSAVNTTYYADKYPDLKKAFGTDGRALMNHWAQYGQYELRSPRNGIGDDVFQQMKKNNLDIVFYANKYPDLKTAFGYDGVKLLNHYLNNGRVEGRVPNKTTDDFLADPPRSAHLRSVMRANDYLLSGERMVSADGRYRLDLQPDAQLVIYEGNPAANTRRWWQNSRGFEVGPQFKYFTSMQEDGHLCTYRGTPGKNEGFIGCSPPGAGGPKGRYFAELQNDGNLVIHKGGGPDDKRGYIWDRITTKPSSGFNLSAAVESVGRFVVSTANTIAGGATSAANTVAAGSTTAANALAREATAAANAVAAGATNAANVLARETVNTANKVANTTEQVAVTVGRGVEAGGQVIAREVVRNGEIVGYAIANAATEAWNYVKGNCGAIGRKVFPIDGYFQGVTRLNDAIGKYAPSADARNWSGQATQCFNWAQDGFYCSFPKELEKLVSQAGSMPGNVINLATRVFNEAKTEECLITGAATIGAGALGLQVCALGKVVVQDAQKAYSCFVAAEAAGIMKSLLPSGASAPFSFPSRQSCEAIGELSFTVAKTLVTQGLSKEAQALKAQGKSNTIAVVADELRTVYKLVSAAATYDKIASGLDGLKACNPDNPNAK